MNANNLEVITYGNYYVTFDWFTPRPHMIIVGKEGTNSTTKCLESMIMEANKQIFAVMSNGDKEDLITIATKTYTEVIKFQPVVVVPGVGSPAVLSLHFGSWFAQKSMHFHAHICINIATYEKWIKRYAKSPILQQRLFKGLDSYLQNAGRSPKDYSNYDFKDLMTVFSEKDDEEDKRLKQDAGLRKLAFNENYMRIGFVSEQQDNVELLKLMDNTIQTFDFLKRNGGHICIDLGTGGFPGYRMLVDNTAVQQVKVRGYLQLPGISFGKLLRAFGIGQDWLKQYNHDGMGIVYT